MAARTNDGFVRGERRGRNFVDWFGRVVGRVEGDTFYDWMGQPIGKIDLTTGTVYDIRGYVVGRVQFESGRWVVRKIEGWIAGTTDDVYEAALLLFPLV